MLFQFSAPTSGSLPPHLCDIKTFHSLFISVLGHLTCSLLHSTVDHRDKFCYSGHTKNPDDDNDDD